ncbi:MAG: ATP-binding protein [Candidatus Nanohaloarchaea archaeon]
MVDGIVSRPGDQTNEFEFITPDDTDIKNGEFIYYNAEVDTGETETEQKKIFARVIGREQERGFPDQFMSNPEVSPKTVAEKLGMNTQGVDIYKIKAKVIGYYNENLQDFTNPRIVPRQGTKIKLAENEDLEEYLTEADPDEGGSAHIGRLLYRPGDEASIELPIDNFTSTHMSILASTGSGKSYTASVIIEEMMQPDSRAAVLIIDPHGEYGSLQEMEDQERFQDPEEGYSPEIQIMQPEDIKIRISELNLSDLYSITDDLSDAQEHLLQEAWNDLQSSKGADFEYVSVNQIKEKCMELAESEETSAAESTANALHWRLDKALDRSLFDSNQNLSLSELLEPGKCTVLQLDTMSLREQRMLVSVLFKKINRARVRHEKGKQSELDFPVFGLLEEGHRFTPADGEAQSLGPLSTILSEGRKFGIGIGIISQRPSKIDDDVLSQCKTQIIMQIQNPLDQDAVKKGVEDVGEDLLSELPGLTPGQAIIAGDSVNTPFPVQIRERYTTHGAESPPITDEWQKTWRENNDLQVEGAVDPDQDEGAENRDELL